MTLKQDLEMCGGCLDMIREDLEAFGLDMSSTPPMMYNDALRDLVGILGLKAGFKTGDEMRAYVLEQRPRKAP